MEQKMTASEIFKDKKDNYPQSVPKLFVSTRLSKTDIILPTWMPGSEDMNAARLWPDRRTFTVVSDYDHGDRQTSIFNSCSVT